jgi:hypothetical protein
MRDEFDRISPTANGKLTLVRSRASGCLAR